MGNSHYNPEIHHRRSIRMPGYDYATSAAYFVTLCTRPRRPIFEIPALRTILEETWFEMSEYINGLHLDEFVIMPDHIHFILWLDREHSREKTLGSVIGAYKSLTFKKWYKYIKINDLNEQASFWQGSFMERVIRNESELTRIRQYIRNNPITAQLKQL